MLIEPTTDATARSVRLKGGDTIQARGNLNTDEVAIEIPDGAGGWRQLTEDGVEVKLSANDNQFTTLGNTVVRINKPETTNSVGIAVI